MKSEGLTIEGLTSDEAIKNIASIYNTDKMTLTNLNVTGNADLNKATIKNADIIKTNKLQFGDKFLMSGVGDFYTNDDWLRFMKADEKGYAGFAAQRLWTADNTINGRNIFAELDALRRDVDNSVKIGGRYGFHRGHDNSVIWGHGIILQPCGSNNCTAG